MSDKQEVFTFARMSPAEYRDDCQQVRLDLSNPRDPVTVEIERAALAAGVKYGPVERALETAILHAESPRLVPCPSCRGSTFDDGERPLVCHCGARIPESGATA